MDEFNDIYSFGDSVKTSKQTGFIIAKEVGSLCYISVKDCKLVLIDLENANYSRVLLIETVNYNLWSLSPKISQII
jgi:hypothetical protein